MTYLWSFIHWLETADVAAITGVVAAISGVVAAIYIWKQTNIANNEYKAKRRPKLTVRFASPELNPGSRARVRYEIVNTGNAKATVTKHNVTVLTKEGEDSEWVSEPLSLGYPRLDHGEADEFVIPLDSFDRAWPMFSSSSTLIIRGVIEYVDTERTIRRTGFARTYDQTLGCFRPSTDHNEEYED